MKKQKYHKLGALWRVPLLQKANVLAVAVAVIGMVTYVGMYNPRAGLEAAEKPPTATARAAPVGSMAQVISDDAASTFQFKQVDLSIFTSNFSSSVSSTVSTAAVWSTHGSRPTHDTPLESSFALTVPNRTWFIMSSP